MAQLSQDQIGDLGELLAAVALSHPVGGRFNRPLFRATFLGGKYPIADVLVDLYKEVQSFWNAAKRIPHQTRFRDG